MINNTPNNLSFSGRFIFKGNKQETAGFVRFIKRELNTNENLYKEPLDIYEFQGSTTVLTHLDALQAREQNNFAEFIKINPALNSEHFYDKQKRKLFPDIIDFSPAFGTFSKIHPEIRKLTTVFKNICSSNNGKTNSYLCSKIDFNKKLNLVNAFDVIATECDDLMQDPIISNHNFEHYKEIIKNDDKFKNIKLQGLSGYGAYSLVFNIDNKEALKLSKFPLYPKEFEPFDLPVTNKGYIKNKSGLLYYCFLPKSKNLEEVRITKKHSRRVIDEILKHNYILAKDMDESTVRQIVIYKSKPYLCDYGCAINKDGTSRLFLAPESGEK